MALVNGTRHVDPISRIEGHLGVKLTVTDGVVTGADVHGNLWRGFENFLIGREPNDAITFVQRICGVCPIPHATASTFAVENVLGYNEGFVTFKWDGTAGGVGVPKKALHIRNLVYSAEFLMSHITHFYHLAAPSYIQGPAMPPWTPYFNDGLYADALLNTGDWAVPQMLTGYSQDLWSAVILSYVTALRIRRLTFEAGALFAGRMPMTSSFVAGGVTVPAEEDLTNKIEVFRSLIEDVGKFIVKQYVPIALALGRLYPGYDNVNNNGVAGLGASDCKGYGAGVGNFLGWGAFPQEDDTLALKGAYKYATDTAATTFLNGKSDVPDAVAMMKTALREHVAHSRYVADAKWGIDASGVGYPGTVIRTEPVRDASGAGKYSWIKAPRFNGKPMEVGPFARLVVNGWYPVDGRTLASVVNPAGLAGYLAYKHPTYAGLDTRMIAADLAIALVRSGLAEVYNGDTKAVDKTNIESMLSTVESVYGKANDFNIRGVVGEWVLGLKGGLSTMDRLRGRALEALVLVQLMIGAYNKADDTFVDSGKTRETSGWLGKLGELATTTSGADSKTYNYRIAADPNNPNAKVSGFGVSEAPRGGLAHFITIENQRISAYQCVVPTTWNASPKDFTGQNGPMEEAMMNIPYSELQSEFTKVGASTATQTESGIEALRIAQSFDPCIACAIH